MQAKPRVRCSGVQPFTQIDFPGSIACIAFLPGCTFRCGYCHNPEFVLPERLKETEESWIDEDAFFAFLDRRRGLLDGVVISGGEPTVHAGLPDFIRKIRERGFRIKLDTNGSRPDVLRALFDERLLDYVAMDVKTSLERYQELVGPCVRPEAIRESIQMIMERSPEYEFRTTLVRELHGAQEIQGLLELVRGARRYALQAFRPAITLDPAFASYTAPDAIQMHVIGEQFRPYVQELLFREE
ncbi:MAG: anaerobic ribonucleoside-triphosphate reductase activating protein [Candidatus Uhrbacteria bacterium]